MEETNKALLRDGDSARTSSNSECGLLAPTVSGLELDGDDTLNNINWLVEDVFLSDAASVIGGPRKSLKTSIALDLLVSLASGEPFLGRFRVSEKRSAYMFCGEGGKQIIRETLQRIYRAKGLSSCPSNIAFNFSPPPLAHKRIGEELEKALTRNGADVLIIDPLYLSLHGGDRAVNEASLIDMGSVFERLTRACENVGATPIILHHSTKVLKPRQKMELHHLAYAGLQEFARQWILINRKSSFKPGSGCHELRLNVGGASGVSHEWNLSINEGQQNRDLTGRVWELQLQHTDEPVDNASNTPKASPSAAVNPQTALAEELFEAVKQKQKESGGKPVKQSEIRKSIGVNGSRLKEAREYLEKSSRLKATRPGKEWLLSVIA